MKKEKKNAKKLLETEIDDFFIGDDGDDIDWWKELNADQEESNEDDIDQEDDGQDDFDAGDDTEIANLLQRNLDNLDQNIDDEDSEYDYNEDDIKRSRIHARRKRKSSSALKIVIPVGCLAAVAFWGYRSGLIEKFINKEFAKVNIRISAAKSEESSDKNENDLNNTVVENENKSSNAAEVGNDNEAGDAVEENNENETANPVDAEDETGLDSKAATETENKTENKEDSEKNEEPAEDAEENVLFDDRKLELFAATDAAKDIVLYEEPDSSEATDLKLTGSRIVAIEDKKTLNEEEWELVNYYGIMGWTKSSNLIALEAERKSKADELIVYADGKDDGTVKLYKEPSELSESLSKLEYGEELEILQIEGMWGEISHNGELVWINMEDTAIYVPGYYYVNVEKQNTLNVRSEASGNGIIQIIIQNRQRIQVDRFSNGWGHVSIGGTEGWVNMHYVIACSADSEIPVDEPVVQNTNDLPQNNVMVTYENTDNDAGDNNYVNDTTDNNIVGDFDNQDGAEEVSNGETDAGSSDIPDNPDTSDVPADEVSEGEN